MERLKDSQPIDLVLLDFVMPRMNGYQFCRALRADAELAQTPVVLMSARTEAIGDRFVEQTGAMDALGKPFDARALIAVVGQVLLRVAEGRIARAAPKPDAMIDEDDLTAGPESIAPASRHFRQLGEVGQLIAEAIGPALKRMPPHQVGEPEYLANAVALSLSDKTLSGLAKALQTIGVHHDPDEILQGDLGGIAIAELLQFLQLQRQTAVLHVSHKKKSMTVYIRDGMVDLVQSVGTDEDFRLGRYFVRKGVMSRDELEKLMSEEHGTTPIGQMLLDQWKVTPVQLKEALVEQSSELCYELVRWTAGHFSVRKEPFPEAASSAKLGLGMSNLVLEGFRRVDEWRVMEKSIDFEAKLVVDKLAVDTVDAEQLGKKEMRLLELMDGERTVRQVMAESTLASFDAIQIVYRIVQSRLARPKG
jgi:CheY-like chemotaxis protein